MISQCEFRLLVEVTCLLAPPTLLNPERGSTSRAAAESLGARLLSPEANMADTEAQFPIPEFSTPLEMDPYLKPYEQDFKRR